MNLQVGSVCNRNVIIANKNASILMAAKLMELNYVDTIIITKNEDIGKKPIGIVTERDLVLKVIAKSMQHINLTLESVMIDDLVCVHEDVDVIEAVRIMYMEGIHRVPVIDEQGFLTGLLTTNDLYEQLIKDVNEFALLVCKPEKH